MPMIWEISINPHNATSAFRALTDAWVESGNKVFVLRGKGIEDVRRFYESHFPQIGRPVAVAEDVELGDRDNQRTGEIWMEVRYDPRHPDAYRHSANAQPLHTDGSYIPVFPNATLMTCVASAGEGGETIFLDGDDLVASLEQEAPDLLAALQARTVAHARSGDRREARIIDNLEGTTRVNWNYYCVDRDIDTEGRRLADRFFDYLASSALVKTHIQSVMLAPGDAVTWKDTQVLHGRNRFVATQESERFLWKCAIDVANFDD